MASTVSSEDSDESLIDAGGDVMRDRRLAVLLDFVVDR